jgi:hypothetical protein
VSYSPACCPTRGRDNGRCGATPRANCWPAPAPGTTVCRPRTLTPTLIFIPAGGFSPGRTVVEWHTPAMCLAPASHEGQTVRHAATSYDMHLQFVATAKAGPLLVRKLAGWQVGGSAHCLFVHHEESATPFSPSAMIAAILVISFAPTRSTERCRGIALLFARGISMLQAHAWRTRTARDQGGLEGG